MRFVIAGGGVAGLAAALAVARAGHSAVVLERDAVATAADSPDGAFEVQRDGIPHFLQPHAFLRAGDGSCARLAPDVLDALTEAGADRRTCRRCCDGAPEPGDEDLVYLWVRRPVIEWALRRAAVAEPGVELRAGAQVSGLLVERRARGARVGVDGGERSAATSSWTRWGATARRRAGRGRRASPPTPARSTTAATSGSPTAWSICRRRC